MGYRTLRQCVDDLAATKQLVRLENEIDPHLEAAEIQRRVYQAGGPAIYFARLKGCRFPAVSNLFGTIERTRYLFRDSLAAVESLIALKTDPARYMAKPWKYLSAIPAALHMLPKRVRTGPALAHETTIDQLPQIVSWPDDGGPFVTLPQVYTEHPERPGWQRSNLGMYRIQLGGNQYAANREIGLHYQIHRGIGVHHTIAKRRGEALRAAIFIGGPPAMTVSAVMPLPETVPELSFAGALGGRRIPIIAQPAGPALYAEADFIITGTIDPNRTLPEGPFGDHLGYYARAHNFPVLQVDKVYHRTDAIWPFTVVGRPPQEDTSFGAFIHELTGPIIPTVIPGVHGVNAVDAAGVHPLLLALGSERYTPYAETRRPQELLTQANAILGQGQMSLAKYLVIAAKDDAPSLDLHDIGAFLRHVLERVDWRRDLHFQTQTTMDTLDYSGSGLNEGSKVVIAAVGPKQRDLPTELSANTDDLRFGDGFSDARVALPGVLMVRGPAFSADATGRDHAVRRYCERFTPTDAMNRWPLIVVVDDAEFAARSLNNFLWTTFTRSNPAADVYGIGEFTTDKHWGCRGSLVIDARRKPHHAPPLVEDPQVTERVNRLAERGGPLHGII
ncbi:MAG: 3-octaprenyl-4-hydroxybenzoate carboxy-lyase [Pirellula sp.]|nr:3-octaprenyl-4-hydroxybenzoate carboxy-lyase [Pirellula sp.]